MNKIIAFFFLFLVIRCNNKNDVPDGILPPGKMQYVMYDMIQAEGLLTYSFDTLMKKPGKRLELYATVLKTHKLSQEEFRKSIQYYQTRPDLLKVVFDSMQQMALRDTTRIVRPDTTKVVKDTVKMVKDTAKIAKDTVKTLRDTLKTNLDTNQKKKSAIHKIRGLRKVKPL